LTAAENVTVPLVIAGWSKRRALVKARDLLGQMGMSDRSEALPTRLSGGQQQRVAIARALVHEPNLLVCDEPTSALDAHTGHAIMELLRGVVEESHRSVVVVTHDSRIFEFGDRVAKMNDGRITSIEEKDAEPVA
jgi:putative ABC transport system ATP-binding protein